jgi:hypothetical protein
MVFALVLTGLGSTLGIAAPAAADHCTEIRLLSGTALLVHTGAVGCAGGADVDTDYVNPGSTNLLVRVFTADQPAGRSTITFSGITGPTGFGGCVAGECVLKWTRGEDAIGEPPGPYYDSQLASIVRNSSIDGGDAVVRICFDASDEHCESRIYRTLA